MNTNEKPIQMISSQAAATLRLIIETRRCWIERMYPAGSQEHMRHTHNLAHLQHELGMEERGIEG